MHAGPLKSHTPQVPLTGWFPWATRDLYGPVSGHCSQPPPSLDLWRFPGPTPSRLCLSWVKEKHTRATPIARHRFCLWGWFLLPQKQRARRQDSNLRGNTGAPASRLVSIALTVWLRVYGGLVWQSPDNTYAEAANRLPSRQPPRK